VVWIASQPNILVVHPSVPVKSVKEFIAYAKAHPGQLNYASSGSGAAAHLAGELFKSMTGVQMVHIPSRVRPRAGRRACRALPADIRHRAFGAALSSGGPAAAARGDHGKAHRHDGGSADGRRVRRAGFRRGDLARPGGHPRHPRAIIDRLNREVNDVLKRPEIKQFLTHQGAQIQGGTPERFAAYIKSEIPKWAKVIKDSGASVD